MVFEDNGSSPSMSVVSDGAECILMNKDFFKRNFDNEQREKIVRLVSDDLSVISVRMTAVRLRWRTSLQCYHQGKLKIIEVLHNSRKALFGIHFELQ